jgi:fructan beta-fructosidase
MISAMIRARLKMILMLMAGCLLLVLHATAQIAGQSEQVAAVSLANTQRVFKIEKRYLNLPIKNGASKIKVTTLVDGRLEVKNDIQLADGQPDWWAFIDVGAWHGKTVTLQVTNLPVGSTALSSIEQSDAIKGGENLYCEPLRGQFHFSSRRGWNNDPNGLVFFNGEYHLFYQHNPYGWSHGNMHWGHAVSRDLVHWEEIGDAIAPDHMGTISSGSAVVDWKNTSGLGKDGKPPLVLVYTAAGKPTTPCITSSTDGRHFTKFSGNPIVKRIGAGRNSDPKVLWHEPTKRWVMLLYIDLPGRQHTIHFLTSPNLIDWTLASITKGEVAQKHFLFECPDFFELPVDGDFSKRKWVLTAANHEYAIGTFDGAKFTAETDKLPGNGGNKGLYAAQTFSDIPASDGRRIQIGWFKSATPGMPFNQSMTIPLEVKLIKTAEGPRQTWTPVKELESLRTKSHRLGSLTLQPGEANPLDKVRAELIELRAEFESGATSVVHFKVRGVAVSYDAAKQELIVNGRRAPAPLRNGKQRLTVFCDRNGLEFFTGDGLTYVPMPVIPDASVLSVEVGVAGTPVKFSSLDVHELKSAWPQP